MNAGLKDEPPFGIFNPNYIAGTGSFVVRMPQTYGQIMLERLPFTAGDKVKYRLEPKEFTGTESRKQKDTGNAWARVTMSPVSTVSDAEALNFVRTTFARVGTSPVDVRFLDDKHTGTGTNLIRVGFEPLSNFNVANLKSISTITAPDGTVWHIRVSKEFAAQHHIHDHCMGLLSKNAPIHLACKCSQQPTAGPSSTAAQRMSAKVSYQERARKRAREDADPFA